MTGTVSASRSHSGVLFWVRNYTWPSRGLSSKLERIFFSAPLWMSRPCSVIERRNRCLNHVWWVGAAGGSLAHSAPGHPALLSVPQDRRGQQGGPSSKAPAQGRLHMLRSPEVPSQLGRPAWVWQEMSPVLGRLKVWWGDPTPERLRTNPGGISQGERVSQACWTSNAGGIKAKGREGIAQ